MRRASGYWNNPRHVDEAFYELSKELGRAPTYREFNQKYGGAYYAIIEGRYDHGITTWNQFLAHRGFEPYNEMGKWTPQAIDKAFDELGKGLGRIPTSREFGDKYSGAWGAITKGRYDSNITTWNQFLTHKGFRPYAEKDKWTPQAIDEAFDELSKELEKTPTQREFGKKCGGAPGAIIRGKYDPGITTWSQFLAHKGIELYQYHRGYKWTPQAIDEAFDELSKDLGRRPTSIEFGDKYSGAWDAIIKGRYDHGVATWNQFLAHRGIEVRKYKWTPQAIDEAFDKLMRDLGRVPVGDEFVKKYGGALDAITHGKYDPSITTWNQFLAHRGFEPYNEMGKWTPQAIDKAFDELGKELGKTPSRKEFGEKYSGAYNAIAKGRYDPGITTWNQFLAHNEIKPCHEIGKWTPQAIDKAFDELTKELRRIPGRTEFVKRYGGTITAIRKGKYDDEIRTWNEFIIHKIISKLPEIFTLDDLLTPGLFNKGPKRVDKNRVNKIVKDALELHKIYQLDNEHYVIGKELFDYYNSLQAGEREEKVAKKRGCPPLQKSLRVFPLEADGKLVRAEHKGYVSGKLGEDGAKTHRDAEINEVSKRIIKILNAANIVPPNAFEYETELARRFSSQEEYIRVYEEGIFPLTTNLMRVVLENESGGNILDIGNGVGAPTLQALVQLGRKFDYLGVDCVNGIQEFNREKHGDVFVTLKVPYEFGKIEGKFDLITASLVLDSLNLPEICTTMIGSHQLLEKNGEIITILSKAREERAQQVLSILKGIGYKVDINPENYYFNLKLKDLNGKNVNNYFYIVRAHKDSELNELDLSKKFEFYLRLSHLKARKFEELRGISTNSGYYLKDIINELLRIEKHDYKEPPFRFFEEFKEKERQKSEMIEKAKEEAKKDVRHPSAISIYEDFAAYFAGDDFLNIKMLERSLAFVRGKLKGPDRIFQKTFHESSEKAMSVIRGKSRYKKRNRFREDLGRYLETLQKNLDFSMLDV